MGHIGLIELVGHVGHIGHLGHIGHIGHIWPIGHMFLICDAHHKYILGIYWAYPGYKKMYFCNDRFLETLYIKAICGF